MITAASMPMPISTRPTSSVPRRRSAASVSLSISGARRCFDLVRLAILTDPLLVTRLTQGRPDRREAAGDLRYRGDQRHAHIGVAGVRRRVGLPPEIGAGQHPHPGLAPEPERGGFA